MGNFNFMPRWTEYDLNAYEARNSPKHRQSVLDSGCDNERELHEQIRQECLLRGWLAFHGSMAHSTFRTEGEPDFVILCNQGNTLLVECKTKKGKLSVAQQAVRAWAARLSHEVHTVRSMDEFLKIANLVTKSPHDNAADSGVPKLHHIRD